MAEYIDKQAVLADLNETYDNMAGFHPQFYNGYQFAVNMLREFPTVDVAEVRNGRWEQRRDCVYCTACGTGHKIRNGVLTAKMYKFCPNCGARMDGRC